MSLTKKMALVLPLLMHVGTIIGRPFVVIPLSSPPAWAWKLCHSYDPHEMLDKFERLCSKPLDRFAQKVTRSQANVLSVPDISGFMGLYNGYVDYSNNDGMLTFPVYGHREKELHLLITPGLKIHFKQNNMLSHIGIDPSLRSKSELYHFKKYKTKEKVRFWRVTKVDLPEDNKISIDTVILLSKPKNIFVEQGDFFSTKSPHIILPNNVFVVGARDKAKTVLKSLDITRFFEDMRYAYETPNELLRQTIPIND